MKICQHCRQRHWLQALCLVAAAALAGCGGGGYGGGGGGGGNAPRLAESHSAPLALTRDSRFVWSVNPDNNSVSVFDVLNDANVRVAEIPVGKEPRRLAITLSTARTIPP